MIKHTFFKRNLAKLTPSQREIACKHFNLLWDRYNSQVEYYRDLWNRHVISLAYYRKVTHVHRSDLLSELKSNLKLIRVM